MSVELLGNAFQKSGRHAEALEIFGILSRELPVVAQNENFRKKVKVSERALGQKDSILPKKKFSLRGLFRRTGGGSASGKSKLLVAGAAVVVFALVMAGVNEYNRRHRTLYVVNAYQKAVTVTIDGAGSIQIAGHAEAAMDSARGQLAGADITGPLEQDVDFQVSTVTSTAGAAALGGS